jgi:hypothetical protein
VAYRWEEVYDRTGFPLEIHMGRKLYGNVNEINLQTADEDRNSDQKKEKKPLHDSSLLLLA